MSFQKEISDARNRIDAIDKQLIELLQTRFRCCLAVGELKRHYEQPVMQPSRVQEVTERAAAAGAAHGMSPEFARQVWQLIIDEACRMEDDVMAAQRGREADATIEVLATTSGLSNA